MAAFTEGLRHPYILETCPKVMAFTVTQRGTFPCLVR